VTPADVNAEVLSAIAIIEFAVAVKSAGRDSFGERLRLSFIAIGLL
jgi:hypothetical protein